MYGIVIAQCGVQRLEQKYRRPFARTNAFGPGVKGSGAPRGRLDGKGRIGLYRQINNMRAAHKGHGALALVQAAAGLMQGRQHRRTGRINAGCRAVPVFHVAQTGQHVGRHIEQVGLLRQIGKGPRHGSLEQAHRACAHKNAHIGVFQGVAAVARIVQGTQGCFKKNALGRVKQAGIVGRKPEPPVIKGGNVRKIGRLTQAGIVKGKAHGIKNLPRFAAPFFGHENILVRASGKIAPEALHIGIIAKAHGHTDNGYGRCGCTAGCNRTANLLHTRNKGGLRADGAF